MAKKTTVARRRSQVRNSMTDLFLETLKEFSPGSTQRLINSSIELMEAHREFLAERIARLERVRTRISKSSRQIRSRSVPVRIRRGSRAKRAAA